VVTYTPRNSEAWQEQYRRFLSLLPARSIA
jgi:hypothetical protein